MTMSANKSNRNSSQGKQESSKQNNSTRPQHSQSDERRKPLPFDDAGDDGAPVATSGSPKLPPPEHDF
jgi:hypothetical protein